jgi:acyl carrier protein
VVNNKKNNRMELNEFIKKFADALDDVDVDVKSISEKTVFKNLSNWSSLCALSTIAMIDEEYGVAVKGSDIRSANTVQDLYDIVHRLTQMGT